MPEASPRWQDVDQTGRHLLVELCQLLLLLRIVTVIVYLVDQEAAPSAVLLALVTTPALVATFWLPRLFSSIKSHPLVSGADVLLLAVVLYLSAGQGAVVLVSVFGACAIGLIYRGAMAAMLTALLVASYLAASTREPPLPGLIEMGAVVSAYLLSVGAGLVVQVRVRQLTGYGAAAASAIAALQERSRLARDMHDGVAKTMHGLALGATAFARSSEVPDSFRRQFEGFAQAAELGAQQARETLVELRAVEDDRPLRIVVEDILDRWSTKSRIDANLDAGSVIDIGPDPRRELLACLREALDNVAEHAGASSVRVGLQRSAGELVLEVEDDGRGIDPNRLNTARRQGRFGVHGMSERMRVVGGHLAVERSGRGGVIVRCTVPLP